MSELPDLSAQKPYALDQLAQLQGKIVRLSKSMVLQRARIERCRQSDLAAARDIYAELSRTRETLVETLAQVQLFLMEMEEYALAKVSGQLRQGLAGFALMSTGYKSVYEALSRFASSLPVGQKTNAAVVGRLMNNIKLGYYPTDPDTLWLEELASAPMSIRSLTEMPEERYALPDHTIEVNAFKGERFNQKELEQQLRRCNSFAQMMARSELDSGVKRPLLPLSISQIGLIGGSGMINGLIACDTPHIIKGRIVKVIRTESEEKFSAQGNHIGSEVKETITNKMIFNVLTPNGFKALT